MYRNIHPYRSDQSAFRTGRTGTVSFARYIVSAGLAVRCGYIRFNLFAPRPGLHQCRPPRPEGAAGNAPPYSRDRSSTARLGRRHAEQYLGRRAEGEDRSSAARLDPRRAEADRQIAQAPLGLVLACTAAAGRRLRRRHAPQTPGRLCSLLLALRAIPKLAGLRWRPCDRSCGRCSRAFPAINPPFRNRFCGRYTQNIPR